jgi:hypothetical protein
MLVEQVLDPLADRVFSPGEFFRGGPWGRALDCHLCTS